MVSNSFNIQYQSTGVGSLSSLDEVAWAKTKCIRFILMYWIWYYFREKIVSLWFFSTIHRYPHRNSTAAAAAAAATLVAAVSKEDEEASIWLIVVFSLTYYSRSWFVIIVTVCVCVCVCVCLSFVLFCPL